MKNVVMILSVLLLITGRASYGQIGGYDAPYFQADYIQDLGEFSAGIVNPALLYRVNQYRFEAGLYRWNVGSNGTFGSGYQQASFIAPISLDHTVGLSYIWTHAGITKEIFNNSGAIQDDGAANFSDMWLIAHYAWRFIPGLSVGANVKFRMQDQFTDTVKVAPGADLGIYWNPMDHYRYGDLGFSLNFQDLYPANLDWSPKSNPTTTRVRFGVRYSGLNDHLVLDLEGLYDNAFAELWAPKYKDASSLSRNLSQASVLKKELRGSLHARWEFIPQIWLKAGWTNNMMPYVGFHFNVIYPFPEMINYLNIDYNIGYSVVDMDRGLTQMGRLSTDFGPTREQRESKNLYDRLILAPMDAYNEAMRLYLAGKYWEAAFAFGKVMSLYPNFYLNDKAAFYMANSYKNLYMNETARAVYKSALEEYSTSEMRSKFLYGLECIDYREGKYDEALKNHAFITNLYSESEIRPDADYVAGQVHFLRKNYNAAEQLLSRIQAGSPMYLYALYTLAIINIENKKMDDAVTELKTIVSDTTPEASVQLLQDAANMKLGHVYYEQVELRNAVDAYKRVPDGSSYSDEALLGTAWSWIKVNQPPATLSAVERLLAAHPESPLVPEAYLLKGYALMLQKKYNEAVVALEKCLDLTKGTFVTEADLTAHQQKYNQVESDFMTTAEKIKKNAMRKPTDKSIEERGAYKSEYDKFAKENQDIFEFTLKAQSHKKFFMRKEQVVQDAEYALAKATSMMKSLGQEKILDTQKKEQEKLDNQIEELKRQLNDKK